MRAATVISCAALLLLCACKGSGSDKPTGKREATPAGRAGSEPAPEKASSDKARPVEPNIPEAELQALLDRWLKAQNEGDFSAYEQLYAKKFGGVKRVGPKTFRYERKGWLANRKLMFRHKMTVEAREPTFSPSPRVAEVSFTQRWASGTFEDLGPKRMLIVREGTDLRIAQEEMLRSELVGPDADKAGDFYFLIDNAMVLRDAIVPDRHGKPRDMGESGPMVIHASVEKSDLDEETRALEGKKVRVDSSCEATVTGFYLVSRVTPHFGMVQEWDCELQEDDCAPTSDEERAAQAFDMGDPVVVAKLDGCQGGTYARLATSPKIIEAEPVKDDALAQKAIKAFGKLGAVKKQAPEDEADGPKNWWVGIEKVSIFEHPESKRVLVSVHADNGGMCGEFTASAWALWEYKGGKLVHLADGTAPLEVLDALDVDGDGELEILVRGDHFGTEAELVEARTLSPLVTLEYSYHDCPC